MQSELQQAIQDAICEDRKQTIESLETFIVSTLNGNTYTEGCNKGIRQAQRYIRALNERDA
jgi:hypothetical protein